MERYTAAWKAKVEAEARNAALGKSMPAPSSQVGLQDQGGTTGGQIEKDVTLSQRARADAVHRRR